MAQTQMGRNAAAMGKGIVAGFVATVVLSIVMIINTYAGLLDFSIVAALSQLAGAPQTFAVGWLLHFLIGSIAWGILYVWLEPLMPGKSYMASGTSFGVLAWLLMMIVFMPVIGAGIFAANLGFGAIVWTLVMHIIYGLVLGATFGKLMHGEKMRSSPAESR